MRQRINEAARSNLLRFAGEKDLDYLAKFYGIERKDDENDESFRKG